MFAAVISSCHQLQKRTGQFQFSVFSFQFSVFKFSCQLIDFFVTHIQVTHHRKHLVDFLCFRKVP